VRFIPTTLKHSVTYFSLAKHADENPQVEK